MRVVVVGAGIAGLTAAAALSRDGHDVVVLERARELASVGAGLGVWPNAARALDWLGLADPLRRVGAPFATTEIRDRRGRILNALDPNEVVATLGGQPLIVHRADLQALLLDAASAAELRLAASAASAGTADGVAHVCLTDGTQVEGDLVIAADGARSSLRRTLDPTPPKEASPVAWRAVLQTKVAVQDAWLSIGDGHQFLATPMANGRVYVAGLIHLPAVAGPPDATSLLRLFQEWHDPVPRLLADLEDEQLRWDPVLHRRAPRTFHTGRLVLIGDAAHPMTPDLGQGGCQAIEDAVLLAALLRRNDTVPAALDEFSRLRRPRVRRVVNESRRIGSALALKNPVAARTRDELMHAMPSTAALAQLRRNASTRSFERQLAATT